MLVGHLAAALGAKRVNPALPLAATVTAAFALDLLWPPLLLLGLESVRIHPGDTAFTQLAFDAYPWSHSLLFVGLWSLLGAGLGRLAFRTWRAGTLIGALVMSHWLLDAVTHRPDLPILPGGPYVGLGLWNSIAGTLALEALLLGAAVAVYLRSSAPLTRGGRWALGSLIGLLTLIWATGPWAPPPPSVGAVAWGGLILWLLPPWAAMVERGARRAAP